MPDQFANAANYLAHYENTALEIWQQTGGEIDYLLCAQPVKGHYIQGLKNMEEAIVPDIYDPSKIDIQELIESEDAIEMARQLILQEGIFAGMIQIPQFIYSYLISITIYVKKLTSKI